MTFAKQTFMVRRATPADLPEARQLMLTVFEQDFGYGYRPEWHADVDDLRGVYLETPRQALFVAVDEATGRVVGAAGVRVGAARSDANPAWLIERYRNTWTAELVRVYVDRAYRKRGLGRRLVAAARQFVAADSQWSLLCLHTDASYPGALDFWQSQATIVHDERGSDSPWQTIYFEMEIPGRPA